MATENRLFLIHRVLVPDADYPKEYAVLVTDCRSIFIRQPKTRSAFWLRGEMRWGTALVTDVTPKTLQDYEQTSLETLERDPMNIMVLHEAVKALVMKADKPTFRVSEFWVKWTMQRQKEVFQVYNFEMSYNRGNGELGRIRFYAVPLGEYFKPKRQTEARQAILQEYAEEIVKVYREVLPADKIEALSTRHEIQFF